MAAEKLQPSRYRALAEVLLLHQMAISRISPSPRCPMRRTSARHSMAEDFLEFGWRYCEHKTRFGIAARCTIYCLSRGRV